MTRPRTFGELKASGYRPHSVKDELRANVIARLRTGEPLFPTVVGYENTVEPQIVNAMVRSWTTGAREKSEARPSATPRQPWITSSACSPAASFSFGRSWLAIRSAKP